MNSCPLLNEDSCLKSELDCTCETCPLQHKKEKKQFRRNDVLTLKDKIEQFKRDCKSNDYYTKAIMECNERIEELDIQLSGLAKNGSDSPKCENASNPYKENKLGLMMLQDQIINERNEYINKINDVSTKLMKIINPLDRQMIIELYINKMKHQGVADKYHMDRKTLYRRIEKVIGDIV